MTFHIQPKEISRQEAVIARTAYPIEAALRFRDFNRAEWISFTYESHLRSMILLSRPMIEKSSVGPNGIGNNFKCTAIWSTKNGIQRFYASGYLSADEAKEAARAGAALSGYVRPTFWGYLLRGGLIFEG